MNSPFMVCAKCKYLPDGPLRCNHPSGDGVPGYKCPENKFNEKPKPPRPKRIKKQESTLCPSLVRTCCGQPNLCAVTGAEVGPGDCESCELKKNITPT